jgi:GcrA cell cycle regulator
MQQGTDTWTVRWPADRVEKLKELWPIMTASQIGRIMGLTRSAVIGKVFRLGLPLKKLDRLLLPKRGRSPPKPVYVPRRRVSAPLAPEVVVSDTTTPGFLNRSFDELGAGECRYPHGDRVPYRFCGNACDGSSSYCIYHQRLCCNGSQR